MIAADDEPSRRWYREAMVWLLIAIPAGALAAGLITLILAYRHADPEIAHTEQAATQRAP